MSAPGVIWLDMDGVIADFIGGALAIHNSPDLFSSPEAKGKWDLEKLLGISVNQFWAPINAQTDFWEGLPKTAEADFIVSLSEVYAGGNYVGVLTAPALGDECFLGKRKWLRRHYPQFVSRLAYSREKALYASPRHLLIDDKDSNCEEFRAAGGAAILVPRPWNTRWAEAAFAKEIISEELTGWR